MAILNMNNMKKFLSTLFIYAVTLLITAGTAQANTAIYQQDGRHHKCAIAEKGKGGPKNFNSEKLKNELRAHITREANLTPKEANVFFPIFFEKKDKQRALQRQKSSMLRHAAKDKMSETDCRRVLQEVENLDKKIQRIEHEYTERLRKRIGCKKLVKAMAADMSFGRKMFHRMTKNR